jgi:uncharacterized protein (TIGR03437 family)
LDGPRYFFNDLLLSLDGKIFYYNSGSSITTIDTARNAILVPPSHLNSSPPGSSIFVPGIALSPDGKLIYLTSAYYDTDALYAISSTPMAGTFDNNPKVLSIPVPPNPYSSGNLSKVTITADDKFAYLLNEIGRSYLVCIDLTMKSAIANIPLGPDSPGLYSTAYALVIVPPAKPVAISIKPQAVSLSLGQSQQFIASVLNDINTAVTWFISPQIGSLSDAGIYTPPNVITSKQTVTITAKSVADPTKSASAAITLTPPGGIIASNTIFNAASMLQGPVAPGEIVDVFGAGFGPADLVSWSPDDSGFVPTQTAGLRLLFDGIPSPILYAAANQVRAVVPYEVGAKAETQVQIECQGQQSNPVTALVTAVAPGIFTLDSSGGGQAMLLNEDGSQNSPSNPAATGSRVVFCATGLGESNPPGVDGQVSQAPFPKPVAAVTVSIGGVDAEVLSAGGAPGSVAELVRVCVRVPDGAASGDAVSLDMSAGGIGSQPGVTLAVP